MLWRRKYLTTKMANTGKYSIAIPSPTKHGPSNPFGLSDASEIQMVAKKMSLRDPARRALLDGLTATL